jgi:hypothetical protein
MVLSTLTTLTSCAYIPFFVLCIYHNLPMHIATNNLSNGWKYNVQLFILTYCTYNLQQYIVPSEYTIVIPVCRIHRMPLCRSSTVHQITNLLTRHDLGFDRKVDNYCALPDYSAASSGNFLPKFQDYLSVPSSWVKNLSFWILDPWRWDQKVVPKHQ